jgi:hypothetical protein
LLRSETSHALLSLWIEKLNLAAGWEIIGCHGMIADDPRLAGGVFERWKALWEVEEISQ